MNVQTPYEQLFFTTAFIRAQMPGKKSGSGTGFFYAVNVAADQLMMFLVTNKHVIEGATKVIVTLIAGIDPGMQKPLLGSARTIEIEPDEFLGHPQEDIDVTVAAIGSSMNELHAEGNWVFLRSLSPAMALTDTIAAELDALEEVTFIGYPNGLYDKLNYLPMARRGITATPVTIDYEGEPVFLVDASVFPGSSGSPVFIAQTGGYPLRGGGFTVDNRLILLGVLSAVYQRKVPILQNTPDSDSAVMDPLNIGIVYKARAIEETVDFALTRFNLERYEDQPDSALIRPAISKDAAVAEESVAGGA
jgi:trypsin-like peptidase